MSGRFARPFGGAIVFVHPTGSSSGAGQLIRLSNRGRPRPRTSSPPMIVTVSADCHRQFDFVFGSWVVRNRKLVDVTDAACDDWIEFDAASEAFPILGGYGHVDRMYVDDPPDGESLALEALPKERSNPISYFVDCIRNDKPIGDPLSARLNVQVMEILDAARESARTGKPQELR